MKINNPLKSVSVVFAFLSVMYLILLFIIPREGRTGESFIRNNAVILIGLCFCLIFYVGYLGKSIFAWWTALIYFPAVFTATTIIRNTPLERMDMAIALVIFSLVLLYLYSKYDSYKDYLDDSAKLHALQKSESSDIDAKNPLQILYYASILHALFTLFYAFTGGSYFMKEFGPLTGYSQYVVAFISIFAFILFYHRKSIFAWWIVLISVPAQQIAFYLFNSFRTTYLIVPALFYSIVIVYLIFKYRPYKEYIMRQKEK